MWDIMVCFRSSCNYLFFDSDWLIRFTGQGIIPLLPMTVMCKCTCNACHQMLFQPGTFARNSSKYWGWEVYKYIFNWYLWKAMTQEILNLSCLLINCLMSFFSWFWCHWIVEFHNVVQVFLNRLDVQAWRRKNC